MNQDALDALLDQAFDAMDAGQIPLAQSQFQQILQHAPEQFDALHMLGVLAMRQQNFPQAVDLIGRALAQDPEFATAQLNMGLACMGANRPQQAVPHFERALALEPQNSQARSGLMAARLARAHALRAAGLHEAALPDYQAALPTFANDAAGWTGQALTQEALGLRDAAQTSYQRSLELDGNQIAALVNLAGLLRDGGQAAEAVSLCQRATELAPDQAEAHMNLGNAHLDQGELPAARQAFARTCELQPTNPEAQWALGWVDLLAGDWERGLPQLEWRWKKERFTSPQRSFKQPLWLGETSPAGQTILLHAEQGLGDTLQFCRYASALVDLGAQVVLEAPVALLGLLQRLHPAVRVVPAGEALPAFDLHCPLMSLPGAFRSRPDDLLAPQAYLRADPQRARAWQDTLGPQTALRVGLVWSGNAAHSNDRHRSLPLSTLLAHLPSGPSYHSLQKEVRETDRPTLTAQAQIRQHAAQLHDFDDTAALIEQMDVVISVDTSVAHLAAAMGKPTWILLPHSPDWRWLMHRNDSPWYPSAKLFRQTQRGQWREPLQAVAAELARHGLRPSSAF